MAWRLADVRERKAEAGVWDGIGYDHGRAGGRAGRGRHVASARTFGTGSVRELEREGDGIGDGEREGERGGEGEGEGEAAAPD